MRKATEVSAEDARTIYETDHQRSPYPATWFEIRREPKARSAITLIISTGHGERPTRGTGYILSPEDALQIAADLVQAVKYDFRG